MAKRFESVERFIEALRAEGVSEVSLSGKVATSTSPKGEQITFRGRITAAADLGGGEMVEYVEEVQRRVTRPTAPDLPISDESATDLQRAQLALARQLRSYRDEYQGVMNAARTGLAQELKAAGITAVEGEG